MFEILVTIKNIFTFQVLLIWLIFLKIIWMKAICINLYSKLRLFQMDEKEDDILLGEK